MVSDSGRRIFKDITPVLPKGCVGAILLPVLNEFRTLWIGSLDGC